MTTFNINSQVQVLTQQLANAPKIQNAESAKFLAPSKSAEEKAKTASQDFESFFLYQMLELTTPEASDGIFGGGHAEEAFSKIKNEHIADEMAKAGGIGLADTIYAQMIKLQEMNQ